MNFFYRFAKTVLWPGPDYGTRVRYGLRRRLLRGGQITTLDLGCGNGCMTMAAAQTGAYALGISNQEDPLTRASHYRDFVGIPQETCEFRMLNVYDLDRADLPQFDQIILFEVLEHLYHDELALSLCAKRLKKDGWLHITVPNRDNHVHFEGVARVETGAHVRHGYDYATLESLLRKHGLEPIDREGIGGVGTVFGFLAVANASKLPGALGQVAGVAAFFLVWPAVKILDLFPCRPWSLYVLAAKREQKDPTPGER